MTLRLLVSIIFAVSMAPSGLSLILAAAKFWPRRCVSGIPYLIVMLLSYATFCLVFSISIVVSLATRTIIPSYADTINLIVLTISVLPFSLTPILFSLQYMGVIDDSLIIRLINKYFPCDKSA